MKKLLMSSLLMVTGCGYLPSITPVPTVTVTVTATPDAKAPTPISTTEAVDKAAKQQNQISKSVVASPPRISSSPSPIKPSKDSYEIRFEGKTGSKVIGMYSIQKPKDVGLGQIEEVENTLPFSVKLELPSDSSVGASLHGVDEGINPKVFIRKNGKECGKALFTGSAIPNPEASKACIPEQ